MKTVILGLTMLLLTLLYMCTLPLLETPAGMIITTMLYIGSLLVLGLNMMLN